MGAVPTSRWTPQAAKAVEIRTRAAIRATWYDPNAEEQEMEKPGNAAVLSLLIPGVGQIYNGKFLRGIFWLLVTPGLWIGSGGTLGWICHLISAYTAYRFASRNQ